MKFEKRIKARNEKRNPAVMLSVTLAIMYAVSGILLLVLAVLLYYFELSEATVKIGIVAVYIMAGFTGGIWCGKQSRDKKYLWGLVAGSLYFVILFILSLVIKQGMEEEAAFETVRMFTTWILCAVSGMAGGMIS